MLRFRLFSSLVCLLTTALIVAPTGLAQAALFDSLLKKVPAGANTLVLIDVTTTLAAPIAEEKGWGKQLELDYVERPIFLPPESTKLVMAASLLPNEGFSRQWELATMELGEPLSMRSIARTEGGYVDEINGAQAAWTPSNAYFVSLGDRELGVIFPAERQFVSRWVTFAQQNSEIVISEYLQSATKLANEKVPILLAIDLHDVVRPHELNIKLQNSPLMKKPGVSLEDVSKVIVSLQGAMLRVAVGKDVQGQLRIDFAEPVAPLKSIAKDLVINAMNDLGAPISDMSDWKVELEEKAITMRGPLSQDGQRRVFSIVEIPSTKFSDLKDAKPTLTKESSESKVRDASLTYYKSTEVLVKDLRRDLRGNVASAAVMERYARKIDRMPILNVDDELLDYGSNVAETLRSMALSKRQGGIQAGTQTAGMGGGGSYGDYSTDYSWAYGGGNDLEAAKQSAARRSADRANAMANSNNMRVKGFELIDEHSAAIRREMTQKYGVEF